MDANAVSAISGAVAAIAALIAVIQAARTTRAATAQRQTEAQASLYRHLVADPARAALERFRDRSIGLIEAQARSVITGQQRIPIVGNTPVQKLLDDFVLEHHRLQAAMLASTQAYRDDALAESVDRAVLAAEDRIVGAIVAVEAQQDEATRDEALKAAIQAVHENWALVLREILRGDPALPDPD